MSKDQQRLETCLNELYTALTQVQLEDMHSSSGKNVLRKYEEFNMVCDQLCIKLHSSLLDIHEFKKRLGYSAPEDEELRDGEYQSLLELKKTMRNIETSLSP